MQPVCHIFVTAGDDAGLAFGVWTFLTFLFLGCLYELCKIIAVLFSHGASGLTVLPEEALFAFTRTGNIIPDPIDDHGFFFADFI